MSKLEHQFKNYLESNLSCDQVNEEMKKLSKYKFLKKNIEKKFIELFMDFCVKNFSDEILELFPNNKGNNLELCIDNLFKISHNILINKDKYKDNIYFETIQLLYQTFFFIEFTEENETNDCTFYIGLPKHVIKPKDYENYLYSIGIAILNQANNSKLLEILFSSKTPLFLQNIILTCFLYIRSTTKNVTDFIYLCIPCLNHYNLYFLSHGINEDLNFLFNQIDEISYIKLEKYILTHDINNEIKEDTENNTNNITNEIKEDKSNIIQINEEISKYFNLPKESEKEKILSFFNDNNLKENQDKFLKFIQSQDIEGGEKYKIIYDNPFKDDISINAFSFAFLLKNGLIQNIDKHYFQIFNYGNKKNELFSNLLSQYLELINNLLKNSITKEQKLELFKNSGFYLLNNEDVLLINIDEKDEMLFYLKSNLGHKIITSINNDEQYKVYHINQSELSSVENNCEREYFHKDDSEEKALFHFGNYSCQHDLRKFFKSFISNKEKIYELPRLYFLMNFAVPLSKNQYQYIAINRINNNNDKGSYGYEELNYVLKNESEEDVLINVEYLPYKEKMFIIFPKTNVNNNKNIILKKKSIIFFEFKTSFPQYYWKEEISQLFEKIKNFLEIYKNRGDYTQEYVQIYFIYDCMPEIPYIKEIENYINNNLSNVFSNFEFGIYYFTRGINIIYNQIMEEKFNNNINELKNKITTIKENSEKEINNTKLFMNEMLSLFDFLNNENINQKVKQLKEKYNIKPEN